MVCDEPGQALCDLGSGIFLQKMSRIAQGCMGLPPRTGHAVLPDQVTASGDRVSIAKQRDEGLAPLPEDRPALFIGSAPGITPTHRHKPRNAPGSQQALARRNGRTLTPP